MRSKGLNSYRCLKRFSSRSSAVRAVWLLLARINLKICRGVNSYFVLIDANEIFAFEFQCLFQFYSHMFQLVSHGQYIQQTQFQAAQMHNNPHMLQLQSGNMSNASQGGGPYANPLQPAHHPVFPGYPGPSVG